MTRVGQVKPKGSKSSSRQGQAGPQKAVWTLSFTGCFTVLHSSLDPASNKNLCSTLCIVSAAPLPPSPSSAAHCSLPIPCLCIRCCPLQHIH